MAESLGTAALTLSVDARQFDAGLNKAKADAAAASQKIGGAFDGVTRAIAGLGGVLGVVGLGVLSQQIAAAGQAAQRAEIQIAALASAYGEAEAATAAVGRISKILGISSLDASQGFSQLYAALRGTGLGLQQLEVLFVGVSNAARLSGASTQEAAGALLQLKQGLASGVLQGDELRSVLEGLPALSQAIAAEIGVNVGQLRKLGSEGKITSEIVFNAAKSLAGAAAPGRAEVERLGIAFQGLQAAVARGFGPAATNALTQVTAGVIAFTRFVEQNQTAIANFGQGVVSLSKALIPLAAGILAVKAGFVAWGVAAKAAAVAQSALLALAGPKGWAILAAGAGFAALAATQLEKGLKGSAAAIAAAKGEADQALASFRSLLSVTNLEPVDPKVPNTLSTAGDELAEKVTEAARKLREAALEGARAYIDAVSRLTDSRLQLAELRGSPEGLNRFLTGQEQFERTRAAIIGLGPELRTALEQGASLLRSQGVGVGRELFGDVRQAFDNAVTGRGASQEALQAISQFIRDVRTEQNAQGEVVTSERELAEVQRGLITANSELRTAVLELVQKSWNVSVNLQGASGAQIIGDVVGAAG